MMITNLYRAALALLLGLQLAGAVAPGVLEAVEDRGESLEDGVEKISPETLDLIEAVAPRLSADPRVAILDKLAGWRRVFADEFAVVHQAEAAPPQ